MNTIAKCLLLLFLGCTQQCLAATTADLVAAFSEGKARAEGRARLVQSCAAATAGIPGPLLTGYEEARATFNSRIDGIVAHIKSNSLRDLDSQEELNRLNDGLSKVDRFARSADEYLSRRKCQFHKKVGWSLAAQLALNPEIWRLIWEAYQKSSLNEAARLELIKQLEAQRIPEWTKVRLTVVFDWTKSQYISADQLTWPLLRSGHAKVYVNEWGLHRSEPELLPAADRPIGLSPSYKLYSGELEKLFKPEVVAPEIPDADRSSNKR